MLYEITGDPEYLPYRRTNLPIASAQTGPTFAILPSHLALHHLIAGPVMVTVTEARFE
jgi:hypothetical protein